MFITNIKDYDQEKLYKCNGVVAIWLIEEKNIPLFGSDDEGNFYFSKNENLEKTIKEIPFYMKEVGGK